MVSLHSNFAKRWFLILISFFGLYNAGEALVAIKMENNLPVRLWGASTFYDGTSDSIYLLGGYRGSAGPTRAIYRFSISNETVEEVGHLVGDGSNGSVEVDSEGNVYYFGGGYNDRSEVYKFNPVDNSCIFVGRVPYAVRYSGSVKLPSKDSVLIFGGQGNTEGILQVDLTTDRVQSELVGAIKYPSQRTSAVKVGDKAVIFVSTNSSYPSYYTLDLSTMESEDVDAGLSAPNLKSPLGVLNVNEDIFVVGDFSPAGYETGFLGFLKINGTTKAWEAVPVENFPLPRDHKFIVPPSVVWVESLNRIYMFGGYAEDAIISYAYYTNEIYYVDLDS